jgi:hypothetical protein
LFKADIDGPPHLAFVPPLRPDRPLLHGGTWVFSCRTTRLRSVRRIQVLQVFALEGMPETLQLENQRSTLRSDAIAVRLADPAR